MVYGLVILTVDLLMSKSIFSLFSLSGLFPLHPTFPISPVVTETEDTGVCN